MEMILRYIQHISGDSPWVMRQIFNTQYVMMLVGSGVCKVFRTNRKVPIAIAVVAGIGVGNLVYLLCLIVNIAYYTYYTYSVLKHVAIGTVEWTVNPIARAIQYVASKMNYSKQVSRKSEKITGIIENAIDSGLEKIGGIEGVKECAKNTFQRPIQNAWHVYKHREQYQYHNIALHNQFEDANDDSEFVSIERIYHPSNSPYEIIPADDIDAVTSLAMRDVHINREEIDISFYLEEDLKRRPLEETMILDGEVTELSDTGAPIIFKPKPRITQSEQPIIVKDETFTLIYEFY